MATKAPGIKKGSKVAWAWGNGHAHGTVSEIMRHDVERSIKGSQITRHGTDDNPALLIVQEDGGEVLKLESEVEVVR